VRRTLNGGLEGLEDRHCVVSKSESWAWLVTERSIGHGLVRCPAASRPERREQDGIFHLTFVVLPFGASILGRGGQQSLAAGFKIPAPQTIANPRLKDKCGDDGNERREVRKDWPGND